MFSRHDAASKSYDFIHPPSREVLSMKFNDFQGGHPKNLIHDRNVEQNKFISEQITNDPSHVQRHADLQLKMRNPLFHEFHYKKLANLPEYQTKSYLNQQGQSPNSENPSDSLDIFQQNYAARQQNQQHSKQGSNLMNYDYSYNNNNNNNSTITPNDNPTNNNNKSLQLLPPQSSKNMNPPLSRQSLNLPEIPTNNNNNLPQPQVNLTSRYTPQQQQQPQQPYYQPQQFQRLSSQRRSQQYLGKNSMGTSSVHLDNNNNNNQSEIDLPPRSRQNELLQLRSPQYQGKPYFNPQNLKPDMNSPQNPPGYLNDGYDNPQYQQQLQLQEQQYINQNNNSNSNNNVPQQQQFQEQSSPGQIPQYDGNNNGALRRESQNEPNQNGRYATPSILNDKKMRRMYNPLISKVSAVYEPRYGVEAHWDKYDREQFRNWENKSKDYIDIVKAKNYVLGKYAEYSTGNHEYGVKKE